MKKKIIKILPIVFVVMFCIVNVVYAAPSDIYNAGEGTRLRFAGRYVAGWIYWAALIAAVVVLMIKGIKFITSSPEGKADVKKEMIPWAVGILILFFFIPILNWIIDLVKDNINTIDHTEVLAVNILNLIK